MIGGWRARGALLGLAVGDALGAPLEGTSPRAARAAAEAGLQMAGGGFWAPGEWTDDTAMALALAGSIAERGLLDTADLARRYIRWATEDGKGMGGTTAAALVGARDEAEARANARAVHERTGQTAGNGTVMRATPIALAAGSVDEAIGAARREAAITHHDPAAGNASAALCAALIAIAADGEPLDAAAEQVAGHERLEPAVAAARVGDDDTLAGLAAGPLAATCWTTLAVALRALARPGYADGVGWAISLGGDTDTNAAVAGALLGSREGAGAIPDRWLEALRGGELVERAAAALGEPEVVAGGGLVVRLERGESQVALVHRPKYDDWSLPKGKPERGESIEETALREVREETGLSCELGEELAPARYFDRKERRKLVRFWRMSPLSGEFEPSREVDALRWATFADADRLLDYEHDRELARTLR